jgi:hypothetical protein
MVSTEPMNDIVIKLGDLIYPTGLLTKSRGGDLS